jgi:hypothetical protein
MTCRLSESGEKPAFGSSYRISILKFNNEI